MSRFVLAPLAVALSALLLAPHSLADPSSPLFVVEQQRSALVTRLAKQWSDAFAVLPMARRLTHEQFSNALFALRADRLFAVTLAGDAEAVEAVLGEAKREAAQPRVAAKALGDATVDLTYTPINPCRILDTRAIAAGPLTPNVARTFDGYSTNFATQGGTGSGCGIPNGVAALAMNVYAVNPTNLGFIKVWPANGTEPDISTVNYQPGITAIATGTLVPVDQANSNRFSAKSPATVDFIADVVGYFKPPGDATGLDIKVAGQRVMRYEYNAISPNVIGGSPANGVSAGVRGATIAGGGVPGYYSDPYHVPGAPNRVTDHYATVSGGLANIAGNDDTTQTNSAFATVSGGHVNNARGAYSTIGGGSGNTSDGFHATTAGGGSNVASGDFSTCGGGIYCLASGGGSTVSGGSGNTASGGGATVGGGDVNVASANASTVAGGLLNRAQGYRSAVCGGESNAAMGDYSSASGGTTNAANGSAAIVPGGAYNTAGGAYSLAAGRRAKAQSLDVPPVGHDGAFVWADSTDFDFNSTAANQFAARATGGVRFVTAIDGTGLPTWTCGVSGGAGGSWGCTSDRDAKIDLVPLDGTSVLERVAALPVYQWAAKDDPRRIPHAGPTAQDFMAVFGLGDNDRMIGFADAQGVLFAAVQGLNAKFEQVVQAKDAAIAAMKAESDAQKREIADLRRVVEALMAREVP